MQNLWELRRPLWSNTYWSRDNQDDCKKLLPKKTVHLIGRAEGYYCENCGKVVAIFSERGAEFLQ